MLRQLKTGGHHVLLFTQMTKMLDILESFLNIYGYTYVRLDGSTKVEERQKLMERYNSDDRIFVFILSTCSGGVGINLTGRRRHRRLFLTRTGTQSWISRPKDRCHRIGQTREVNIYRLVSRHTIEENILKKSMQKRHMNSIVIGDGNFTTEFFDKIDPRELLGLKKIKEVRAAGADEEKGKDEEKEKEKEKGVEEGEGEGEDKADDEGPSQQEMMAMAMANAEDEDDRSAVLRVLCRE